MNSVFLICILLISHWRLVWSLVCMMQIPEFGVYIAEIYEPIFIYHALNKYMFFN
jgi:hypothetical protein